MDIKEMKDSIVREFKLTTLALKNRTSVMLLTLTIVLFGIVSYIVLPKELFPEVNLPYIMVQTIYSGNPPSDMENLVTRVLEKELESVKGVKKMNSTSSQDASSIMLEFNFDVDVKDAKQEVKDAVDRAESDLPNDLTVDPMVIEIDVSEFPVLNLNLSGDYSIDELKKYGEILEERIEAVPEISKVEIQGIADKEVRVDVDLHKLNSRILALSDIENAIARENMSISSGEVRIDGTTRSLRTIGEFKTIDEIKNIIVKHENGNIVYLRDVADVKFAYEYPTSFARLDGKPVVSLQVIKKSGENLLNAIDKIKAIEQEVRAKNLIPDNLEISTTGDQSHIIRNQLSNLVNSIFISMLFVIIVLYFFLGTRNALIVGLAIPLSMLMSVMIINLIGWKINMIVLFSLILALGMLVDNAIVVVENIYRFIDKGYEKLEATKRAVGEIALPIIASTATTLAAFFPLIFWDSIMGEFMSYLPITLIIVLTSSLFVALVIVPVFAVILIKKNAQNEIPVFKKSMIIAIVLGVMAVFFYIFSNSITNIFANLFAVGAILTLANYFVLNKLSRWFQNVLLAKLENIYDKILRYAITGYRAIFFLIGTIILFIITMIFYGSRDIKTEFFPSQDPQFINVMAELPIGTDIKKTDEIVKKIEEKVFQIVKPYDTAITSIVTQIGEGAKLENDMDGSLGKNPNKGLINIHFEEFQNRAGISSAKVMSILSDSLIGKFPGIEIIVEKNHNGPPTGKEINIEISGYDFDSLLVESRKLIEEINSHNIAGIEGLKSDLKTGKPEMLVYPNREVTRRNGISTAQIGSELRKALYGSEVSDFKVEEEEYPIMVRLMERYRNDPTSLMLQNITFRNMKGQMVQIPISSITDSINPKSTNTISAIKRKKSKRTVTVYSNVIEGYNANEVNEKIKKVLDSYEVTDNYTVKMTGQQEEQMEAMMFIIQAFGIAVVLILIILVAQFNSAIKPAIIVFSVPLSTIGVFGGLATFEMNFVIVMTGIGIVSLAGVVVNNAIVLVDYIDLLKSRKRKEYGLADDDFLPIELATECVVEAGKTRLRPVLLTAVTTILGLLPMALGISIDFPSLFMNFDPLFMIGGDVADMWAPLSWTVIFGLSFATFLTLVIVPVVYRIATRTKYYMLVWFKGYKPPTVEELQAR